MNAGRCQFQLPGNALDIIRTAVEVNVFAGEGLELFELRLNGQIAFGPI